MAPRSPPRRPRLPERAEAGRNYDYRYAWIRDICYIGHAGAAVAGGEVMLDDAVRWVCARLLEDGPEAAGLPRRRDDRSPSPSTSALPGYPGGSDVVGNRVSQQFQLDLFGEVLLIFAMAASQDRLDADGWRAAEVALRAIERTRPTRRRPGSGRSSPVDCGPTAGSSASPASRRSPSRRRRYVGGTKRSVSPTTCSAGGRTACTRRAAGNARRTTRGSTPRSSSRRSGGASHPRTHVPSPPALPSLKELCDDDFLYRFAEDGRAPRAGRGRIPDLQLLDVPGLPR